MNLIHNPKKLIPILIVVTVVVVLLAINLSANDQQTIIDWAPCIKDPNEASLVHCSEQYRICREGGDTKDTCLSKDYGVLEPATAASIDEREGCMYPELGHTKEDCDNTFSAYKNRNSE